MSGATTKEILDEFTLAATSGNLKTAIIGLDLFSFNKNRKAYKEFDDSIFQPTVLTFPLLVKEYISLAATGDSVSMLIQNNKPYIPLYSTDGSFTIDQMQDRLRLAGGYRKFFLFQFLGFTS